MQVCRGDGLTRNPWPVTELIIPRSVTTAVRARILPQSVDVIASIISLSDESEHKLLPTSDGRTAVQHPHFYVQNLCNRCATCVIGSACVHKLSCCAQHRQSSQAGIGAGRQQPPRLCGQRKTSTANINKLVHNRAGMYCHTCQVRAAQNWGSATSTTTALYRRYGTRWTYATRRFDCKALHRSTSSWNVLMPGSE